MLCPFPIILRFCKSLPGMECGFLHSMDYVNQPCIQPFVFVSTGARVNSTVFVEPPLWHPVLMQSLDLCYQRGILQEFPFRSHLWYH